MNEIVYSVDPNRKTDNDNPTMFSLTLKTVIFITVLDAKEKVVGLSCTIRVRTRSESTGLRETRIRKVVGLGRTVGPEATFWRVGLAGLTSPETVGKGVMGQNGLTVMKHKTNLQIELNDLCEVNKLFVNVS